jgi:hypothetical protein
MSDDSEPGDVAEEAAEEGQQNPNLADEGVPSDDAPGGSGPPPAGSGSSGA